MYTADYHVHTNWSHDGKDSMDALANTAVEKKIDEICFTDHFELTGDWEIIDYSKYILEYEKVREKYLEKVELKLGVELGILNDKLAGFSQLVKTFPFDYVLASTHRINNISPSSPKFFMGINKLEGYIKYFQYMLESVQKFDDFDCWGHLDYVIRYGNFTEKGFKYFEVQDILDEILKTIISKRKGIEINSSNKRKEKNFHPSKEILQRYFELGGEIVCFGSDAHIKEHIGSYSKEASELLLSLGKKYISVFNKRKVDFIKI